MRGGARRRAEKAAAFRVMMVKALPARVNVADLMWKAAALMMMKAAAVRVNVAALRMIV